MKSEQVWLRMMNRSSKEGRPLARKPRSIDIELMRIIAAFFVIFNHTGNKGFFLFSRFATNTPQFWIYQLPAIFCKLSVPLFLMITGALLLGREPEPLKTLWKQRVLRMVLVLLVWSYFYYLVEVFWVQSRAYSFKVFLRQVYECTLRGSFWYLYMLIPLLMCLPLLQRMVKNLTDRDFVYMLALVLVFKAVIPIAEYRLWHGEHKVYGAFQPEWLIAYTFIYPCLGYWLQRSFRAEVWTGGRLALLWAVNLATMAVTCWITAYMVDVTGICREGTSGVFFNSFGVVKCATIFITCKVIAARVRIPAWLQRAIVSIGGCTFGIYLLHSFFLKKTKWVSALWNMIIRDWGWNSMLSTLLICALVFLLSYGVTLILKRIPGVRRLV